LGVAWPEIIRWAVGSVCISVSGAPIAGAGHAVGDGERLLAVLRDVRLAEGRRSRDLAAGLRAAIMSGEIPVGARLPPQRELALLMSVGRTTVVTAYNLLRGESLVKMTQGAGTWVVGGSKSATGKDA
jgi:Bacterial regulatory proteins, gntR family